jgi:hypothetical protein
MTAWQYPQLVINRVSGAGEVTEDLAIGAPSGGGQVGRRELLRQRHTVLELMNRVG